MSINTTLNYSPNFDTKKRKSKGIDGYYIAHGKIKVLKKDWVFGI